MFIPIKSQVLRLTGMFCRKCKLNTNNSVVVAKINLVQSIIFKGAFHQRRSSLNQVQIWPWPRFSRNFCCTNAVQIKSRVKLGLTLNRRGRRIKLWSSVQLALNSGSRTVIRAVFVQIGDNSEQKCICVGILHPVSGYPSLNNYFNSLLRLL